MSPFFANPNPIPSSPAGITIGFPIVNFGWNFGFFKMQIFKKQKKIGEKIEKIKIASQDFKLCPWATQSPNMSFQLPLGSKIIAAQFCSPDFWGCRGFWITFNGNPIENDPEPSRSPKIRTSKLRSYNLRPQRELEAHIR